MQVQPQRQQQQGDTRTNGDHRLCTASFRFRSAAAWAAGGTSPGTTLRGGLLGTTEHSRIHVTCGQHRKSRLLPCELERSCRRVTTGLFSFKKKRNRRQRCPQRHRASGACVKCFSVGSFGNRLGNHMKRNPLTHVLQRGCKVRLLGSRKRSQIGRAGVGQQSIEVRKRDEFRGIAVCV